MNAGNTFENEILKLIFQNTDITGIGDSGGLRGSVTAGSVYVRLCTDAVEVSDSQIGTECAYTGYVAGGAAVERSASGWSVSGSEIKNVAEVTFGACAAGSENVRYMEIWRNNTGTLEAERIAWGQLSSDIAVSVGVTPKFAAESITVTFN